ncbi:hypothetical protein AB0B28_22435 [Glycomyces sp. NPDC046736]|uniref:hypothetical protein n=1 Tax=Glycomyces sp. NPDC046736 TaxID=3155615 RepID=UPI00340A835B
MGLFGAIGRETKGAVRSLSYDLRRSRRFRRVGAIAVVTVAGGVLATGALLREPIPGLAGMDGDGEGSDIIDGWFGLGAGTAGQEAEESDATSDDAEWDATRGVEGLESTQEAQESRSRAGGGTAAPGTSPGLVPIGEETSGPGGEESSPGTPSPDPSTGSPTDGPTSDEPTEGPTSEEPTEEPTTEEPTSEPGPSDIATSGPEEAKSPITSAAPQPRKAPL